MFNQSKSRRDFIKTMSGVAAAPFISMPSRNVFAQTKAPLRFLTLIDTYGLAQGPRAETWIKSTSDDYALTSSDLGSVLKPLEAYINNMLVVSNIDLDSVSKTSDSRTHHYLTTHTLTGSSALTESRANEATQAIKHASLDLHIGNYLSTEYGLSSQRRYEHLFFTDYAQRTEATFCYDSSGNQKRSIAGALNVRNSVFDTVDTANASLLSVSDQVRIETLKMVRERVNALSGNLNNANKEEVIKAYQESIDSVSQELDLKSQNVFAIPAELAAGVTNSGSNKSDPDAVPLMFKNIYHAFANDMVSSITYAFGGEKINQHKYSHLYNEAEHSDAELKALMAKNFHSPSHQSTDVANKYHELVRIYESQQLAVLLDRLSTTIDLDGSTVLDNTVIFFTSQMANNTHNTSDYPLLIIAGKNSNLQGGFHYDCNNQTNNDLYTTLAQGMTMPDDNFGGHNRSGSYVSALNNGPITKMLKS